MPANRFRNHVFTQPQRRASVASTLEAIDNFAHERDRVRDVEKRREAVDLEGVLTKGLDPDAHLLQSRGVTLHPFRVARRQLECLREEQSLRRNTLLL